MWCQFQSLCGAAFLAVAVFFAMGAEAEYKRWGSQAGVVQDSLTLAEALV